LASRGTGILPPRFAGLVDPQVKPPGTRPERNIGCKEMQKTDLYPSFFKGGLNGDVYTFDGNT
jgi:hypothetical protein